MGTHSIALAFVASLMLKSVLAGQADPRGVVLDSVVIAGPQERAGVANAHTGPAAKAAVLVAAQADSELALLHGTRRVEPDQVRLIPFHEQPLPGFQLWRAEISVGQSHWHPYLVAANESGVLRLGGFTAPELLHAVPALPRVNMSDEVRTLQLARCLAQLADPYGAAELVYPNAASRPGTDTSIVDRWSRRRPATLPNDSISHTSATGFEVRVTVLTRAAHNVWAGWTAIAYTFEFDTSLRLLAWARQVGPSF